MNIQATLLGRDKARASNLSAISALDQLMNGMARNFSWTFGRAL